MPNKKKILLSGIKPTEKLHIGNYFGAMKQFVEMQDDYDCYLFVADYHALTTLHDAEKVGEFTKDVILGYLGVGLDPEKVTLFKQSEINEHTELGWIFNCLVTMPYLMRAHAFKDAQAKNKEITAGTFTYPALMAADILLYDTDVVPVGQDQKQHVEYARDIAQKFNSTFGETFKLPEPKILEEVAVVPGIDGQKMSKSYGNTIPLFAADDEIKKAVMSIVTDSKGVEESKDPEADNVFAFHKLFSADQLPELEKRYKEGGIGHKESKDILIENMIKFIAPMRERRAEFEKDEKKVSEILENGRAKAQSVAADKMADVRKKIGVN